MQWTTVHARAAPRLNSRPLLTLHQFRADFRPQIAFAVGEAIGADGQLWYHIRLPMRPNGTLGWVPAVSVDLTPTTRRIVIGLNARRLSLYAGHRLLLRTTVAIGASGAETPTGHFYVAARFHPLDPFYGPFALETSAYSRLSEWPGGGIVGIHGTSMPSLLGQAVSHGCVRVANAAALALGRLVPLGTPIAIVP